MDVSAFCRQSSVLIVAGKGGVGKTTMVAALARMAANEGLSVLAVELEGRRGISSAFGDGGDLSYSGTVLTAAGADDLGDPEDEDTVLPGGTVHARMITPDDALLEYLADHGLRRMSKRLQSSGVLDVVASAIPGIKDILVLGKIKQIERSGIADLILVDAPATGHTMTFLSSASGLLDAARGGPVRAQAADVVELLTDPARCQVALVTLPEEMPVNEVVEAAYQLEDKVGIALGPVITNACYAGVTLSDDARAALEEARTFRVTRQDLQLEQLERLAAELPLPQLRAPYLFSATIGPEELDILARSLAAGIGDLAEPVKRPQSLSS